ncbi:S8 family serine peptidase [Blastococcus sp. SYSU DS0533]
MERTDLAHRGPRLGGLELMTMTHKTFRTLTVAAVATALAAGTAGTATAAPAPSSAEQVPVIVQELPGAGSGPERAVAGAGGTVGRQLDIIDAFSASVPLDRLGALRATPGVRAVTEDAAIELTSTEVTSQTGEFGSMDSITDRIGASNMWQKGYTGKGVDVAVIDSGVVPVDGLRAPGKVVHGPDLSFEAQQCDALGMNCTDSPAEHLDGYGHGTAMAGIIAGRDDAAPAKLTNSSGDVDFLGVAPDARIVSVKVADAGGSSDVSQVIAGIDWVVQNRNKNGLNVRVLNLSFGTDGVQDYQLDPLTYAVEVAWHAGITVVVSAGNTGSATGKLANPAYDPYVLAVGAVDEGGTKGTGNDVIPSWSTRGDGVRNPDLVAPGASVVSLRAPGSYADLLHPEARVGSRFFKGSGTSQAAAVLSGSAALLLSQRPTMTPDQVKALLTGTAKYIDSADPVGQGRGVVDLARAVGTTPPSAAAAAQTWPRATGTGSLEAARGSAHVVLGGAELTGERDVTGAAWNASAWAKAASAEKTWSGGELTGSRWSGGAWNGRTWFGHTHNADHYGGQRWDGTTWLDTPWLAESEGSLAARTWAARTWAGATWNASTWAASTWAARTWAARTWAASTWG